MILATIFFVDSASSGSVSSAPARTIIAFQIAQPRPRGHVASSAGNCSLNTRWLSPDRNVHAIVVSHAGSPIPDVPKSMTALSRPAESRSRLPGRDQPRDKRGSDVCLLHEHALLGTLAPCARKPV